MKKQFLYTILILCVFGKLCSQTFTPTETYTYTYSRTYLEPVTYNASNVNSNDNKKQLQSVQYTDGLGRPKQDIAIKATYAGNDLVSTYFYDPVTGRQTRQYLPVAKASMLGGLQSISEADINNYYGIANAYSEVKTENSPLSRPVETAAPGDAWKLSGGKTKKVDYLFNGLNEVKKYTAASDADENVFYPLVVAAGNYAANTLHKIKSTDEDNNVSVAYKNSTGQTLMTRQENGAENLDTYYIYNQYGQLTMILPPKASALALTQDVKDQLCYIYRYDAKGRLIEKKLPGKGKEQMVYDKADRLILYRDARMTTDGKWLITKYDKFGRVIYTGFYPDIARADIQNVIGDLVIVENPESTGFARNGMQIYYSNVYFVDIETIISVNYYDTYPTGAPSKPTAIPETALSSDNLADRSTKTMPTASYVKNISDDKWTKTYYWYDQRGRSIGAQEINHLGGVTTTHTELDWAGTTKKLETIHQRLPSSSFVNVKERFVYNSRNYLEEHYHQVNSNTEELLAKYTYNELGQVTNKQVGNNLQSIDYSYNVRGWLTNINDVNTIGNKFFAYKINYTSRDGLETPNLDFSNQKVLPRYNGNITEVAWKAINYIGEIPAAIPHRQGFVYDKVNRVTAGLYQKPGSPSAKAANEIVENYDLNGNITRLKRSSNNKKTTNILIDNLTYNLEGNRITSVTDATGNVSGYEGGAGVISYDDNGNMTSMADKGITGIRYNFLNLAEQITQQNVTSYYYRADGVKTRKEFILNNEAGSNTITTDYLDGFVYTTPRVEVLREALDMQDPSTVSATHAGEEEIFAGLVNIGPADPPTDARLALAYFPTAEGYYDYENSRYIYQYKDHLGNVRSSYARNPDTNEVEILDRNDYYTFGMNLYEQNSVYDAMGTPLNNKYNQKELQETGFYDYGWRQYMPDLGRWFGMDKLSETYNSFSPYAYVANNPISFLDPDGRSIKPIDNGWEFTGNDITVLFGYFSSGGSYSNLTSQLGSFSNFFGSGATSPFWNSFNGGNTFGGVKVQGGNVKWWTNGAAGGIESDGSERIQGLIGHIAKLGKGLQDNFGDYMKDAWNGDLEGNESIDGIVGSPYFSPTSLGLDQAISKSASYLATALDKKSSVNFTLRNSSANPALRTKVAGTMFETSRVAKIAKGIKVAGSVLAVAGVGVSVYQFSTGQISGLEFGMDMTATIVGFMGPIGATASLIYFGAKTASEANGYQWFDKPIN